MLEKTKQFLKENKIALIITLALFIIPFFWYKNGEVDFGGDASRLYFYMPVEWLKNITLYSINLLSVFGSNYFMIPYLLVLSLFHKMGLDAPALASLINGLKLSLAFLLIYFILKELLEKKDKIFSAAQQWSAIIAGLFLTLSPILILEWNRAAYYHLSIIVYPLIFLFALKFMKTRKSKYLIYAAITTLIFSVSFSVATIPWSTSFFVFTLLFLGLLFLNNKKRFIVFIVLFALLFILINAFQLLPQFFPIFNPTSPLHTMIFASERKANHGLAYFDSVVAPVRLIFPALNLPQYGILTDFNPELKAIVYPYGGKYIYLSAIFLSLILLGVFLRKLKTAETENNKYLIDPVKTQIFLLLFFVIILYLTSANIGSWGRDLYREFFDLPGFSMFRAFYTKFIFVFMFFYALLLGISLEAIFQKINTKRFWKYLIIIPLSAFIIYNAVPLLSGRMVNEILWMSKNVKSTTKFSPDFEKSITVIREAPLDVKYLSLPLTTESCHLVAGENGGVYYGPSTLSILAGKADFLGRDSFNMGFGVHLYSLYDELVRSRNLEKLHKLLTFLSIKYVFLDSDDYLHVNFPRFPYDDDQKRLFPDKASYDRFITDLALNQNFQHGNFSLSERKNYLPHIYTPTSITVSNESPPKLSELLIKSEMDVASAIFFSSQNNGLKKISALSAETITQPILEFKKINLIKYAVRVHQVNAPFVLVFTDQFNKDWKIYPSAIPYPQNTNKLLDKTITEDNIRYITNPNQTRVEELTNYLEKGWVTDLTNETDKIDFISQNSFNSIQNNNLNNGKIWDNWFKEPLFDAEHFFANGFANSWLIDPAEIKNFSKNPDGSMNFDLIIEFWPQRLLYWGMVISGFTFLSCLIYLIILSCKKNKK